MVTVIEIPGRAVFHHKMNIEEMTWLEVDWFPDMNSRWKDSISSKTFDIKIEQEARQIPTARR